MFVCPNCKTVVNLEFSSCSKCTYEYIYTKNNFSYDYDTLLFKQYKKKYLLNKVLNNNGYISYKFLQEGSLSLSNREDVQNFKKYLLQQISLVKEANLLDIGCGLLEVPGYLDFQADKLEHYGLEPLDESKFFGHLITGCSEFIPLEDNSMDYIIFATSLDHVCSIDATLQEVARVLKKDGKVILWMSDQSKTIIEKIKSKLRTVRDTFKKGYRTDLYYVYPNMTVLQVPKGAVDPFHSFFESPKIIKKMFSTYKFELDNMQYKSKNQVFLTFVKSA